MTNILTSAEALACLRLDATHAVVTMLLPAIDGYLERATGRNWTLDSTIDPVAKAAAQMLLVQWFENPAMIGSIGEMAYGLNNVIGQLQAKALLLGHQNVPYEALAISASLPADGDEGFAVAANLTLIFNHPMASGATSCVTLATAAGASVTVVNSLDVTTRIMTINPTGSLVAGTDYILEITSAPDSYGQTLTQEIRFTTAE